MKIILSGKSTKLTNKEVRSVVRWAAAELMGDRLSENVKVTIRFRDNLEKNDSGLCWVTDDEYRKFKIEVNDKKARSHQLRTLLHEMVHVKQYARGELRDSLRNVQMSRWQGKVHNENEYDYWDLPWEIEAHGREEGLYRMYLEHKKRLAKNK